MASFVRIRRLHRAPLRVGSVTVSNSRDGSVINLDDPKVQRDLKNSYDRWVFIDRALNARATVYPTVQVVSLTNTGSAYTFKMTYGTTEGATVYTRASNATAAALQTGLRTLTGDGSLTVTGATNTGPFTVRFVAVTTPKVLSVSSATGAVAGSVSAAVREVSNMSVYDAATALVLFGGSVGGTEHAWTMNLPAGFTVREVAVMASVAGGAASTHGWLTVATFDGSANLTYQAVSADLTADIVAAGRNVFQPVVSAGVPYVTPSEGQYIFTMTLVTGSSTVATIAGATVIDVPTANRLAGPVPQTVNTYGNASGAITVMPWAAAVGPGSQTTPPAVAATSAMSGYAASNLIPYTEVS